MDPAELARAATAALAPYLIQAGKTVVEEAAKKLPEQLGKVWSMIEAKFAGKPAAEAAAKDLVENPSDEDNQGAFELQVKKVIKDDPEFGENLSSALAKSNSPASVVNTGSGAAVSGGGVAAGAGGIAIGGGVGGSLVFGNNNSVGESRKSVE